MLAQDKNRASLPPRRTFLLISGGALAALILSRLDPIAPLIVQAASKPPKQVKIVEFTDSGERIDVVTVPMIRKTEAEWKKQLSDASFKVTRNEETERPNSGTLLNVHEPGVFRCICCDNAVFNSNTKFESGTGWPSFWQPIARENVAEISDIVSGFNSSTTVTAISCTRCEAHLGHLFHDGPRPTGLRYCMNSVAMRFAKAS